MEKDDIYNQTDHALQNHRDSFLTVGYFFDLIRKKRLFEPEYATFADFTEKRYGLKRAMAYGYAKVWNRFGNVETAEDGSIKPVISPSFAEFSLTQLLVMTSASDEDLEDLSPDMTVDEIRKTVRRRHKKARPSPEPESSASATDNTEKERETDVRTSTVPQADYRQFHMIAEADSYEALISQAAIKLPSLLNAHSNCTTYFTLSVAFEEVQGANIVFSNT